MVKKIGLMLASLAILIGCYYASLRTYLAIWDQLSQSDWFQPVIDINFRVGIMVHDLTSLVIYYLIFRFVFKKNIYKMSDMTLMSPQSTGIIVVLSIFMGIWMMSFVRFPAIADNFPQFKEAFDFLLGKNIWFFVLFWVIHSFYKEIFFRGLIFNSMQTVFPTWLSIFFLGIIYGALFFNLDLALSSYGMLGAVILCLVYIWQKSIWSTIISEFVLFSTYFVYHWMNPEYGIGVLSAFIISTPIILYLMYLVWKTRPGKTSPSGRASNIGLTSKA